LTFILRVLMNGIIDPDCLYDNAPLMSIAWLRRGVRIISLSGLHLRLCLWSSCA
jgi:hypothetical protein